MARTKEETVAIGRIKVIEKQVKGLDREDLSAFRDWFRKYDSEAWDRQMERDARTGKLEGAVRQAVREYQRGKTREL
jgi:predicted esterase